MNHIGYTTLNTLQCKPEGSPEEKRYDDLLEQVGATMGSNKTLAIVFSYILLVSTDHPEGDSASHEESAHTSDKVAQIERTLIDMLYRYVCALFSPELGMGLHTAIMDCRKHLRELTLIKRMRQLSNIKQNDVAWPEVQHRHEPHQLQM